MTCWIFRYPTVFPRGSRYTYTNCHHLISLISAIADCGMLRLPCHRAAESLRWAACARAESKRSTKSRGNTKRPHISLYTAIEKVRLNACMTNVHATLVHLHFSSCGQTWALAPVKVLMARELWCTTGIGIWRPDSMQSPAITVRIFSTPVLAKVRGPLPSYSVFVPLRCRVRARHDRDTPSKRLWLDKSFQAMHILSFIVFDSKSFLSVHSLHSLKSTTASGKSQAWLCLFQTQIYLY